MTDRANDPMVDQDKADPQFDAMTARLLRREALCRAAQELNNTSGPGLEETAARISAEAPEEAALRNAAAREPDHADEAPDRKPTEREK